MMILKVAAALGTASLAAACIPQYHPPTLAEPHATLKVRRTYDTAGGTTLRERLLVDDHLLFQGDVPVQLAQVPRIDASLVHPVPATFVMSSSFFHAEARQVMETYYVQESYSGTESYSCNSGSGANVSYRTCTRSVTRYRSVPRTRWVTKIVEVPDGACQAQSRFAPLPKRVYLLQYSYQEPSACSLSCFEQLPNADGSFHTQACPPAPPP